MNSISLVSLASLLSNHFSPASSIIEEEGGYPVERFVANMDEYLCAICREVCRSPVSINCGHTFCGSCLQRSESNFRNQCPQCRTLISQAVPSFNMKMKIDGSMIRCQYEEYGCTVQNAVCRITDHEEECLHRHIECKQCKKQQLFSTMDEHMRDTCLYRPVPCQDCISQVPFQLLEQHNEICIMKNVKCQDCDGEFRRLILQSHHMNECQKHIIPCQYSNYGCPFSCRRELMKEHVDSVNHMEMVCGTMDKKMAEWDSLLDSQLQNGPFRVSGHGHVVMLCSDLDQSICKSCRIPIQPRNDRFFGYACGSGCNYFLCLSCFPKHRLYRSKRSNIPQAI